MKKLLIILIILSSCYCSGCMYVVRYDGDYRGRVFDGDTKVPIEGAAVLGVWNTASPTVAGAVHSFYDARETLTDKNGEFMIPGMGLRILSNLEPPSLVVFKAGYNSESIPWKAIHPKEELDKPIHDKTIDRSSFPYRGKYTKDYWPYMNSNDVAQFPLRRLTPEERKYFTEPDYYSVPEYLMPLMGKEIDRDRVERGIGPMFEKRR